MKEKFRKLVKKKNRIYANLSLLQWDLETKTPIKSRAYLSELVAELSMQEYDLFTSEEFKNLVEELNKEKESLSEIERKEIEISMEEIEKMKKIPSDEYEAYAKLTSINQGIWEEAKAKNDFSIIKDGLEKIFYYSKKFAEYRRKNEKNLYDVLLNDYEKGMDTEKLDIFFSELKKEIVPFLKKIQEKKKTLKEEYKLNVPVDEDIQFKFAKYLSEYVGFDFEKGLIETSEHPFTLNLNKNDVRLTTNNKKNMPFSTVFSIIHESGHGIYEQQTADNLIDTLLGTGGTMGLHESQSRFMENIVARNKAFWKPLYKKSQEFYPFLKDISFEEFSKQINKIEPGLIRVEADELTYSLHIMVRYEIEKMIFANEVNIDELPKIWNQKMKEYLGIEPKNGAEGVMQDVHWYCGLIGYFPSYAIGNAYASQIYNAMKKDFDVEKALENQELNKITDWLGEKIHKYGRLKDTTEIIKEITGEELNPKYYIEYLKEKYSKIYQI